MIEGCGPFLTKLRSMRDHQKALVESEIRANFKSDKTYTVLDMEKEDLTVLSNITKVAEAMLLGDGE